MSPRKDLTPARLKGRRPAVRVYLEGGRIKVRWTEHGRARYRTWIDSLANRQEAKAWATGRFDGLTLPEQRTTLTTRQLWDRYEASQFSSLAERTRALYAGRWRKWELFIGTTTPAESVATAQVDEFRQQMAKHHAVDQVRSFVRVIKIVYNWADQLELIQRNRVARYRFKVAKSEKRNEPAEYSSAEYNAILRALGGGQAGRRWKTWVAVLLAGSQGERIKAIRSLRWDDVDLNAGRIHWPMETNKQHRERWQPLTWEGYSALLTARWWADHRATDPHRAHNRRVPVGPLVLPSSADPTKPYPYAAFHAVLATAEREAGVAHRRWRAAHGFRKMAAGNVADTTGDALLGLRWIGDTDPRRAKEYIKTRDEQLERIAARRPEGAE